MSATPTLQVVVRRTLRGEGKWEEVCHGTWSLPGEPILSGEPLPQAIFDSFFSSWSDFAPDETAIGGRGVDRDEMYEYEMIWERDSPD